MIRDLTCWLTGLYLEKVSVFETSDQGVTYISSRADDVTLNS